MRKSPFAREVIKPYVVGDDVRKYHIRANKRFLIYTYKGIDVSACRGILDHLAAYKDRLIRRATRQEWFELQQPQRAYAASYESPKIIYPDIAKESRFALDESGFYPADTTFSIPVRDLYLLGVLNSRLAFFYLSAVCPVLGDPHHGGRLRLKLNYVQQLPIRVADFADASDKARHDKMVSLVERMLDLHKQLPKTKTDLEKTAVERQTQATDSQIDQLMYELYGLTEEEIRIVEGETK